MCVRQLRCGLPTGAVRTGVSKLASGPDAFPFMPLCHDSRKQAVPALVVSCLTVAHTRTSASVAPNIPPPLGPGLMSP